MDFSKYIDEIKALKAKISTLGVLDPALVKNIDDWYRVELTYTSNAIEGNTLSRQETALVIEKDISPEGKSLNELLETKNHSEAFDLVKSFLKQIKSYNDITLPMILDIHRIILKKIDDQNAGRLRTVPVRIAGSTSIMPNPNKVPELMNEFISWLHGSDVADIATKAIETHYRLVSIHPFTDGNGRTARLIMNMILMAMDYSPMIIKKEDRKAYITSLEKAQVSSDTSDYYDFMYRNMIVSMKEYLSMVHG